MKPRELTIELTEMQGRKILICTSEMSVVAARMYHGSIVSTPLSTWYVREDYDQIVERITGTVPARVVFKRLVR